jgi:hypothetical protein
MSCLRMEIGKHTPPFATKMDYDTNSTTARHLRRRNTTTSVAV